MKCNAASRHPATIRAIYGLLLYSNVLALLTMSVLLSNTVNSIPSASFETLEPCASAPAPAVVAIVNHHFANAVFNATVDIVRAIATANHLDATHLLSSVGLATATGTATGPTKSLHPSLTSLTPTPPTWVSGDENTAMTAQEWMSMTVTAPSTSALAKPSKPILKKPRSRASGEKTNGGNGNEPKFLLPFIPPANLDITQCGCNGIEYAFGLFTKCKSEVRDDTTLLCTGCTVLKEKGLLCGMLADRVAAGLYKFKDCRGRSPKAYTSVLASKKQDIAEVQKWAQTAGIIIPEEHWTHVSTRGRPKKNPGDASTVASSAGTAANKSKEMLAPPAPVAPLAPPAPSATPAAPATHKTIQFNTLELDTVEHGKEIKVLIYVNAETNMAYFSTDMTDPTNLSIGKVVMGESGELDDIEMNDVFYARYPEDPYRDGVNDLLAGTGAADVDDADAKSGISDLTEATM